jgi:3-dehydroquinate dehydratase
MYAIDIKVTSNKESFNDLYHFLDYVRGPNINYVRAAEGESYPAGDWDRILVSNIEQSIIKNELKEDFNQSTQEYTVTLFSETQTNAQQFYNNMMNSEVFNGLKDYADKIGLTYTVSTREMVESISSFSTVPIV